jgi:ribose transport system substrate-binding protein
MKILRLIPVFFLSTFLIITSCNSGKKEGQNQEKTEKKLRIAVIPKGTSHQFWKSIEAGAKKAGEETGVEIIWQGPQKEDDRQMQIQVVQNFISQQADAIVLAPLDERSLVPPVKTAVSQNIPVVIIDSDLNSKEYKSFIATDNYAGGKLCAKRMAEITGGTGKLIVMRYQEGSASTSQREQGFLDGIKEYAPKIELLSSNQYAGATIEKALQTSQNLLNQYGKEVSAVFCSNESATAGMLRALQITGKAGKVKFVGFDTSEPLLTGLKKGEINGLAVQNPFQMGYLGVKTAVNIIRKQSFDKRIDTGIKMITSENLETPEIQELIKNP